MFIAWLSIPNFVINGNHINGLEGFWGYLKRKLAAKGGIKHERLHLYLGEHVWRYNYRHMNLKEQEIYLQKLLNKYIRYYIRSENSNFTQSINDDRLITTLWLAEASPLLFLLDGNING